MRAKHIAGGLVSFGLGLFLAFLYSPQVVEFIKAAIQPVLILIGLMALAAVVFGRTTFKKVNLALAVVTLALGFYGLYDEYYAVKDFFSGFITILLLVMGFVSVAHGIKRLI
ncbi:MAG: hypothetical protein HQK55_11905 [Deltaproteobacteria bacterium]|nr:hypothetical protein [Deltaproteobacteria bacterium]